MTKAYKRVSTFFVTLANDFLRPTNPHLEISQGHKVHTLERALVGLRENGRKTAEVNASTETVRRSRTTIPEAVTIYVNVHTYTRDGLAHDALGSRVQLVKVTLPHLQENNEDVASKPAFPL